MNDGSMKGLDWEQWGLEREWILGTHKGCIPAFRPVRLRPGRLGLEMHVSRFFGGIPGCDSGS